MALSQRRIQPAIDPMIERGKQNRHTSTVQVRGVRPISLINPVMILALFAFVILCSYILEYAYLQSVTHTRDHLKDQYNLLNIQRESIRSAILNQNKQEVIQAWAVKHGMVLAPNTGIVETAQAN